jgi:L-lactate utilization protein LutB
MSEEIEMTLRALEKHGFDAVFADDREVAKKIIMQSVPENAVVGIGDSTTLFQIGVIEQLHSRGLSIVNPFSAKIFQPKIWRSVAARSFLSDIFLTGTNAVTQDGKLLNIDYVGNRVAGMIFGPEKVTIVVGKNKIVRNIDEALQRVKHIIAPQHAKMRGFNVPCVTTGKCTDCAVKERICHVTTIIERRPALTEIKIILIDEDLGLGWNPQWPTERINKILMAYKKHVWNPPSESVVNV